MNDKQLNGFDIEAIDNTVSALKDNPKIAEFKFRAINKWETGFRNKSALQGFYGACEEDTSRTEPFEFSTDMPYVLNGTNTAPNPPEFLLHTLASCISTSTMLLASVEGIKIENLTIRVEGDINFNGLLGLDSCILKEYEKINVTIDVEGDLTSEEKNLLLDLAQKSPMYNTIINPVPVKMVLNN